MEQTTIYKQPGDGQQTNLVRQVQNAGAVVRLIDAASYDKYIPSVTRPNTRRKVVFVVENTEVASIETMLQIFRDIDATAKIDDHTAVFRNMPQRETCA